MSTKGKTLSVATRRKISLVKRKFTKDQLLESYARYIDHLNENESELPTLEGLALTIGATTATLMDYAQRYAEVAQAVDHVSTLQAHELLTKGSTGKRNPVFSIFLLKSKHNYTDSPQQLTQNNYMNISPEVMREALEMMQDKPPKK